LFSSHDQVGDLVGRALAPSVEGREFESMVSIYYLRPRTGLVGPASV